MTTTCYRNAANWWLLKVMIWQQDDGYDNLLYGSRVMATEIYDKAA